MFSVDNLISLSFDFPVSNSTLQAPGTPSLTDRRAPSSPSCMESPYIYVVLSSSANASPFLSLHPPRQTQISVPKTAMDTTMVFDLFLIFQRPFQTFCQIHCSKPTHSVCVVPFLYQFYWKHALRNNLPIP